MNNLARIFENALQITTTIAREADFTDEQLGHAAQTLEEAIISLNETYGRIEATRLHNKETGDLARTTQDKLADGVTLIRGANRVEMVAGQIAKFDEDQLYKLVCYLKPDKKRQLWEQLSHWATEG